jgi:hypothetical protein
MYNYLVKFKNYKNNYIFVKFLYNKMTMRPSIKEQMIRQLSLKK